MLIDEVELQRRKAPAFQNHFQLAIREDIIVICESPDNYYNIISQNNSE